MMRAVTLTLGDGAFGLGTVSAGPFETTDAYTISSPYGPRQSFDTQGGTTGDFHNGLDIAGNDGVGLVALFPQTEIVGVFSADPSLGNFIITKPAGLGPDDDGYCLVDYYHMAAPATVVAGDVVPEGTVLGNVGMTGKATGPHLHLGVRNRWGYIDPYNFLLSGGIANAPASIAAQAAIPATLTTEELIAYLQRGGAWVDLGTSGDGTHNVALFWTPK